MVGTIQMTMIVSNTFEHTPLSALVAAPQAVARGRKSAAAATATAPWATSASASAAPPQRAATATAPGCGLIERCRNLKVTSSGVKLVCVEGKGARESGTRAKNLAQFWRSEQEGEERQGEDREAQREHRLKRMNRMRTMMVNMSRQQQN